MRAAWWAPKYKNLYQDMLGPDFPVPTTTRWLMEHNTQWLGGVGLLTLLVVGLAAGARNLGVVLAGGTVGILLLGLMKEGASAALLGPMFEVLKQLGSGG